MSRVLKLLHLVVLCSSARLMLIDGLFTTSIIFRIIKFSLKVEFYMIGGSTNTGLFSRVA
jgi:hypothetical protein